MGELFRRESSGAFSTRQQEPYRNLDRLRKARNYAHWVKRAAFRNLDRLRYALTFLLRTQMRYHHTNLCITDAFRYDVFDRTQMR